MDDSVIVCRCEEVTLGEIKKAIAGGASDINGIKRRTRAGMGLCQGRSCEHLLMYVLARELHKPVDDIEPARARPPILPVTFGLLAGEENG